jgi:hypothetical protein
MVKDRFYSGGRALPRDVFAGRRLSGDDRPMIKLGRFVAGVSLAVLGSACGSAIASHPAQDPGIARPPQAVPAPEATGAAEVHSPLRALIIGGGPDKAHNQVAIESNVRYVGRLLPPASQYHVLFTDGNLKSENVQFRDARLLAYRAPDLPRLDGGADLTAVRAELTAVAADARTHPDSDVLLYFTGHGSPDRRTTYANNWFDLWAGGHFTVTNLAGSLKAFPAATPITLVMVQCFSGAFGNVLFEDGDPQGALVAQHVAGFFAAVPQRVAAGCTPAINEAEYKDFTGYFFAALTGRDRMGRPVSGADYDHDGRVGMNEAFAWSLVHDDSIDTPVCTSDTFLRRFVTTPDGEVFATSFKTLESWAAPAQRAALDGLADALRLGGDDRLRVAFEKFGRMRPDSMLIDDVRLIRFVSLARSIALAHVLGLSGDEATKRRFAELLVAESRNPFTT